MRLMAGLDGPTRGVILFDCVDVTGAPVRRTRIAVFPARTAAVGDAPERGKPIVTKKFDCHRVCCRTIAPLS
jgi:hypothetical protein